MILAAIDPGLSGAICFLDAGTGEIDVHDMPVLKVASGREVDAHALSAIFYQKHAGHAFVEMAWNRPHDGGNNSFKSGVGYGIIRGVLAAIGVPYTTVSPQKWKRDLRVSDGKDGSRQRAKELFPSYAELFARVKDDGRAESCLICEWGRRSLTGNSK